jgi:hypothetical protein
MWCDAPESMTHAAGEEAAVSAVAFSARQKRSIRNNHSVRLKHPGVPDGSDGSDRALYHLMENYTLPVAQVSGRIA